MDRTTLIIVYILISILNLCNAQLLTLQNYHQENLQYRLSHVPSKKQTISVVVASKLCKERLEGPCKSSESNGSEKDNDGNTRDSASQMSINPKLGDNLGDKRSCSNGSKGINTRQLDKDALGATGSG